jgi:hypothetical protein
VANSRAGYGDRRDVKSKAVTIHVKISLDALRVHLTPI